MDCEESYCSKHCVLYSRLTVLRWSFLVLLAIPVLGCGRNDPPKVQVYPVSGKVTLEGGEIPIGAYVVLHAKERTASLPVGISPSGTVGPDGTFKITVYEPNDGAPPGSYAATIIWKKTVEAEGESYNGPNVLPKEYASPEASPVQVTVKDEPTELSVIHIVHKNSQPGRR